MAEKLEIKAVQVGKNYNVTLGDERFTITGDKKKLAPVKEAVKLYKEKPTKNNHQALLKLLKPRTEEVEGMKSRIKADVKSTKKEVAKEVSEKKEKEKKAAVKKVVKDIEDKEYSQEELEEMEKAIAKAKDKKKTEAPAQRSSTPPPGRESYYR